MANTTADLDWIDCHALRRDEAARGDGGERLASLSRYSADSASAWRSGLKLIEPDGTVIDLSDVAAIDAVNEAAQAAAKEAEAQARAEEEARLKAEEEAKAKAQAEAQKKAEEKAKLEAEEQARLEAAAKAVEEAKTKKQAAEAEARLKAEAAAKAKREAAEAAAAKAKAAEEAKAKAEAEAKAKKEAEEQAKREAEEKARKEAEAKAKAEAEAKAKKEAEEKAKREAEEKARQEAEAKAKAEAEAKAKKEAEEKAKREAEEKARKEAEAKAKAEAEAKARKEAEEKARKEAEAKAKAEAAAKAKKEAEEKAKREAEEKARQEAEAKAKAEEEARAKAEAEAKAKRLAAERARLEAEAKAIKEAEAEAQAKKEAEAKARQDAARNLGETYRKLIAANGPISLAQYMGESNTRYYASRDPLGEEGDFITAPEVSQMFGELIGLWFADIWAKMGQSKNIHYVELGPGRGTLSMDALKTASRYGFDPAIHFVEGSPALRDLQKEFFPGATHHDDVSTLPEDRPLLIVANEFFDALPVTQLVRSADGWYERMVGLEDDKLTFVAGQQMLDDIVPPSWKNAPQGTMIETSTAAVAIMAEIATRLKNQGGAALIIDYGSFEARSGSTLQALKSHKKVDPLTHPGEADLTAHVDFERLKQVAEEYGAEVMGLQMQSEWLDQMGINVRTEALKRKEPGNEDVIQRQYDRLMRDDQMGALFKVLGVCGRRWPIGAGFD